MVTSFKPRLGFESSAAMTVSMMPAARSVCACAAIMASLVAAWLSPHTERVWVFSMPWILLLVVVVVGRRGRREEVVFVGDFLGGILVFAWLGCWKAVFLVFFFLAGEFVEEEGVGCIWEREIVNGIM